MLPDLLAPDDDELAAFNQDDPNYFPHAASAAIRAYCGWHIAPSVTVADLKCAVGEDGIVMLPSRHITGLSRVYSTSFGTVPQDYKILRGVPSSRTPVERVTTKS